MFGAVASRYQRGLLVLFVGLFCRLARGVVRRVFDFWVRFVAGVSFLFFEMRAGDVSNSRVRVFFRE